MCRFSSWLEVWDSFIFFFGDLSRGWPEGSLFNSYNTEVYGRMLHQYLDCSTFLTGPLVQWIECSPIAWETGVQSQVKSYQTLKKWFLTSHCLTLSITRYLSRVKWSNPGKVVVPFPTLRCSSYWKGSLRVTLD